MKRTEALAYRIRAQQLDRAMTSRAFTEADILDFGVQDSGRDGASWALANRGVPVESAGRVRVLCRSGLGLDVAQCTALLPPRGSG